MMFDLIVLHDDENNTHSCLLKTIQMVKERRMTATCFVDQRGESATSLRDSLKSTVMRREWQQQRIRSWHAESGLDISCVFD
jgi:hypothetical protein